MASQVQLNKKGGINLKSKQSKLTTLIDLFFEIVKNSLLFWLSFVSKGLIYGLLPSLYRSFSFSKEPTNQHDSFKENWKKGRLFLEYQSWLSFSWSVLISLLWALIFYGRWHSTAIIQFLIVVMILSVAILTIYAVWVAYLATIMVNYPVLYGIALDQMIRHLGVSFAIGIFVFIFLWCAYMNLIFFLFIAPGVLISVCHKTLKKVVIKNEEC